MTDTPTPLPITLSAAQAEVISLRAEVATLRESEAQMREALEWYGVPAAQPAQVTGYWAVEEWKVWKGPDPVNPRWADIGFACGSYDDAVGLMDYEAQAFPNRIRRVVFRASAASTPPDSAELAAIDAVNAPVVPPDSADADLDTLFAEAKAEAEKAMRKFPQPNYVISKVAEEAGEVVKAAIHCAEGRATPEYVVGEIKQAMAMLIRLYIEGDQVHGLPPLSAALRAKGART
jgi:hypothetical protein